MKYYKTGEFAKMANVSLRTIRYYDTVGLLKPSVVQDNGYRLYSDSDLVKLQQILSLKYLGFSLDEIFSMTVNNDSSSLKESLELQSKLVKQKIDHLRLVEESIEKTRELLDTNESMDWSYLLSRPFCVNLHIRIWHFFSIKIKLSCTSFILIPTTKYIITWQFTRFCRRIVFIRL